MFVNTRTSHVKDYSTQMVVRRTRGAGYDYNVVFLASSGGATPFNPRCGKADFFQPGAQGQFSVRFMV
jgi:hypothetical protein